MQGEVWRDCECCSMPSKGHELHLENFGFTCSLLCQWYCFFPACKTTDCQFSRNDWTGRKDLLNYPIKVFRYISCILKDAGNGISLKMNLLCLLSFFIVTIVFACPKIYKSCVVLTLTILWYHVASLNENSDFTTTNVCFVFNFQIYCWHLGKYISNESLWTQFPSPCPLGQTSLFI